MMPAWVRHLMALSPLRYFIDIVNGILLKGIGIEMLWSQVLAIALLGGKPAGHRDVAVSTPVSVTGLHGLAPPMSTSIP
jgi:hypothetical protein